VNDNGKEYSQDWQEEPPENRRQRQALPVRHMPKAKPETGQGASAVVLPQLLATDRTIG
jgi:hypothetical protein